MKKLLFSPVLSLHPRIRWGGLGIILALYIGTLSALFTLNTGCGTTPQALTTEQHIYQAGTNVVGIIDKLAPVLPPPFCSAAEAGTALAAAGLAAWNAWQHKQISSLKNGAGAVAAAKVANDAYIASHAAGVASAVQSPTIHLAQPGGSAASERGVTEWIVIFPGGLDRQKDKQVSGRDNVPFMG